MQEGPPQNRGQTGAPEKFGDFSGKGRAQNGAPKSPWTFGEEEEQGSGRMFAPWGGRSRAEFAPTRNGCPAKGGQTTGPRKVPRLSGERTSNAAEWMPGERRTDNGPPKVLGLLGKRTSNGMERMFAVYGGRSGVEFVRTRERSLRGRGSGLCKNRGPQKSLDFWGRGGARERLQFSPPGGNGDKRTLLRRGGKWNA